MSARVVEADDGLPAEVVGPWAKEKHSYLGRYLELAREARRMYIGPGKAGATFVDLFSAYGRARIGETKEFIDGSAVAAWKTSQSHGTAFSSIYVGDLIPERRTVCLQRLKDLHAPAKELAGDALAAAKAYVASINPYGLHFAFLDPHSLGALDFRIIETLCQLKRIDMLIHVSAMDLQRNLLGQISAQEARQFDAFAPGWKGNVDTRRPAQAVRASVLDYWRRLVEKSGATTGGVAPLIEATGGQRLYWLMFAAKSELAHRLWTAVSKLDREPQML